MKIEIVKGDITKTAVDAIVNAANSSLLGGGGVDGAIHRAGGPAILEDCRKIIAKQGGCKTGEAVITTAGKLPSKYVIHTVGPVWNGGQNDENKKLASCYFNSLSLAVEHGCAHGIRGWREPAAVIAIETITTFLNSNNFIGKVLLICFDDENYTLAKRELERLSPGV